MNMYVISQEEYEARRSRLMNRLDRGVVILTSYPLRTMSNDTHYKFRQHSDLLYFTGFPEPDTTMILENNGEDIKYSLFVPERDPEYEIWNGRRYGVEGAMNEFQTDEAFTSEELDEKLVEILKKHETVYYTLGDNPDIDYLVTESIKEAVNSRDKEGKGPVNLINPLDTIHALRIIKSDAEIELLKRSAEISAEAMVKGIAATKPGLHEFQIEAVIDYVFSKHGATRQAYPSIVGGGVNATILHYIENRDQLKDGDLLLVDAGAEFHGYAADISRTWPINGKFTPPQEEIYNLVLETQREVIEMVKPGVKLWDIHEKTIELLTNGLIKFGLLEGKLENLIEDEEYKRFYMHGTSHWLGMDVHDTSRVDRKKAILEPNQYFTIEPGVYIPDEEDIPEKYRGIGVRIEDDILVTEDGFEILTENVVKEIDKIEELVGSIALP